MSSFATTRARPRPFSSLSFLPRPSLPTYLLQLVSPLTNFIISLIAGPRSPLLPLQPLPRQGPYPPPLPVHPRPLDRQTSDTLHRETVRGHRRRVTHPSLDPDARSAYDQAPGRDVARNRSSQGLHRLSVRAAHDGGVPRGDASGRGGEGGGFYAVPSIHVLDDRELNQRAGKGVEEGRGGGREEGWGSEADRVECD